MVRPTTRASNHRQSLVVSRSLAGDSFPPPHPPIARLVRSRVAPPPHRPRVIAAPTASRHRKNPITFPIESLARALAAPARASPPPHRSTQTFHHHRSHRVATPARPRARVHAPSSARWIATSPVTATVSSPRARRAIDPIDPIDPIPIPSTFARTSPIVPAVVARSTNPRASAAAPSPPPTDGRVASLESERSPTRATDRSRVFTHHGVPLAPALSRPVASVDRPGGRHRRAGPPAHGES